MYSPFPQKGQAIAWDKPGATEQQKKQDKYDCEKDAQMVAKNSMTIIQAQLRQLAACYETKGYVVTKRQE